MNIFNVGMMKDFIPCPDLDYSVNQGWCGYIEGTDKQYSDYANIIGDTLVSECPFCGRKVKGKILIYKDVSTSGSVVVNYLLTGG